MKLTRCDRCGAEAQRLLATRTVRLELEQPQALVWHDADGEPVHQVGDLCSSCRVLINRLVQFGLEASKVEIGRLLELYLIDSDHDPSSWPHNEAATPGGPQCAACLEIQAARQSEEVHRGETGPSTNT